MFTCKYRFTYVHTYTIFKHPYTCCTCSAKGNFNVNFITEVTKVTMSLDWVSFWKSRC